MRTVDAEKNLQIGIWKAKTGDLDEYLQPYEWGGIEEVGDIAWTPKGDYLLVVTRPGGFFVAHNINLFSVRTGKHVADFTGCVLGIRGMGQLQSTGELVVGCLDGNIRFWDFSEALAQVKSFEATTRF
jgi:WD40 repeat protein